VAPDYIGLKASGEPSPELHPYLVGEATAIASWDALRAAETVVAEHSSNALSAGSVAVWGASQGGHAAAFTVRYGPYYAPEYTMSAGVYAIPPTDLNPHLSSALSEIRSATANTILFFATASQWYRVGNGTSDIFLPPFDQEIPAALAVDCSPSLDATSLDEVFTEAALESVSDRGFDGFEPWSCMATQNSLTTTSVTRADAVPGLMILAENDTLVSSAIERESFDRLCDQGMELYFLECEGASHSEGFLFSIDNALDFIDETRAGTLNRATQCARSAPVRCANTP
ncbi:MAG: lipase family protein, partial [Myxococcota bacterium]